MLRYNTQLRRLILPEYGRNIQAMVDHCLTIEDREERNHCARSIVKAMGNLFPELRDSEANRHKLWDHLAVMSGFALDIDWPFEPPAHEALATGPEKVAYTGRDIRYRHYGRILQEMIAKATEMEPGEERDALVDLLANHMKKLLSAVNKDGADDARIFRELAEYSHGELRLDPETRHLHEFEIIAPVTSKKKRKK